MRLKLFGFIVYCIPVLLRVLTGNSQRTFENQKALIFHLTPSVNQMESQQNIPTGLGRLDVSITEKDGELVLKVFGTFPTNGEKPRFSLEKNDPQGINPTILLLTLRFGTLVKASGTSSASAFYSETLESRGQYSSIQVVDSDSRTLVTATID